MMTRLEMIQALNEMLLCDLPKYRDKAKRFADDISSQRWLLRSLMNVRPPLPLSCDYLRLQDELLSAEREKKGIIHINDLPFHNNIALWQGDITRLNVDAIVNAANSQMLGCFFPCHSCIDNAIHSAAGLQLRQECNEIQQLQGHEEPTGTAKITGAYNLPSKHIIHTVGPIIFGELTQHDCDFLASCYHSCLALSEENGLKSIAFCCISTGEFHFPNDKAAEIAVHTVKNYLEGGKMKIVINTFKNEDHIVYKKLLE